MAAAASKGYAVGYFESWSLDSLQGVIDAAEQTRSPVIIGFNGEFLSGRRNAALDDLSVYGRLGRAMAENTRVPCGLIFNECSKKDWVDRAVVSGFNLVMPIDPGGPPGHYKRRVKQLVARARSNDVAVEAQVERAQEDFVMTDPAAAAKFASETDVDLLAVEVGNEEIRLKGRVDLDLARLEAVHRAVDLPLVLHGGTGVSDDSVREALRLGVRKVNYGTYIKQHYLDALSGGLRADINNPHDLLGGGSATDVLEIGRAAVRDAVLERIDLLGCGGMA
jgi:fructose/tagatose bisphosphate aldolase